MRRTNFRLPLSDIHYDFAAATSTAFDTLVIGGGVSGSMIAGKLMGEKDKVLVIERGDNCLRPAKGYSDWVYHMPANMVVNRAINKQFVHRRPQNISNDALKQILAGAEQNGFECTNLITKKKTAANQGEEETKASNESNNNSIDIQSPNVLGGSHIVLGGRSWFRGIESDWATPSTTSSDPTALQKDDNIKQLLPWQFDPRGIQLLRRLESIPPPEENRMKYFSGWSEAQPTARGKKGTFRLSRPSQFSELFKPVLDGMVMSGCELTSQWDDDELPKAVGAGRINTVMTCHLTSMGHSTLSAYLAPYLEVQNNVLDDCTVESLIPGSDGKSAAGAVVRDNQTGEKKEIKAKRVILSAGASQSPKLLKSLASSSAMSTNNNNNSIASKIGHMESMWTTPTVVLRYKINQPISLAPSSSALVRALVVEEWRRFGTGWGCSAFDDMTCFYNVAPDIARADFTKQMMQQKQQKKNSNSNNKEGGDDSAMELPKLSPYSPQVQDSTSGYGLNVGEPRWLRINTQPFIMNGEGNFHHEHGFQLRISLCRPYSRGGLVKKQKKINDSNSNKSTEDQEEFEVDYRPLSDERDVEALKHGVDFVTKAIFSGFPPDRGLMAAPFDAEVVLDGPHGGGCLPHEVVDPKEFRVKGLDNVFVADGSTHPHGQLADSHLYTMMATESMHENALARKLGSLDL